MRIEIVLQKTNDDGSPRDKQTFPFPPPNGEIETGEAAPWDRIKVNLVERLGKQPEIIIFQYIGDKAEQPTPPVTVGSGEVILAKGTRMSANRVGDGRH